VSVEVADSTAAVVAAADTGDFPLRAGKKPGAPPSAALSFARLRWESTQLIPNGLAVEFALALAVVLNLETLKP
jgi:hypothetical protein